MVRLRRRTVAPPPMMADDGRDLIIRAEDVVKVYDTGSTQLTALKEIDLSIARGEMVAVMGPSGCGKTTLLNCLSGLDDVTSGTIWIEGKNLAEMDDDERTDYRATRMGFVFQVYNLLPVLSAIENVEMPLLVSGTSPKEARRRAEEALATVGLAEWAGHRPAELSGGQRQRVTIARSLVNDPAIVWADEPTGALDSNTAGEILDLMIQLNKEQGLTLVLVSHDPWVGRQCNRLIQMRDGEIIADHTDRAAIEEAAGVLH
jgi:ABC-type lipoprotein export system ATPase subunit